MPSFLAAILATLCLLLSQTGKMLDEYSPAHAPASEKSVVRIANGYGTSVGFVIEYEGQHLIITNEHAVDDEAFAVYVCFEQACEETDVLLRYAEPDVAVLRSPWDGATPLEVSFNFSAGQSVEMTSPILRRTVEGQVVGENGPFLKFAGETASGFSGAPVMNMEDQVLAVHRGIGLHDGLGYAVTMTAVFKLLDRDL